MRIGGIEVMLNDQLQDAQVSRQVRVIALGHIMNAQANGFMAQTAFLGKAREGVGGFRLIIMSPTLDTRKFTIVVPGMPPWP